MQKNIVSIVQLFPDFEEKIDFLYQMDENFRDLCSDYLLCVSMVLDRKNQLNKNIEELAEFEELQKVMEIEIQNEIQKEKNRII